MKVLGITAWLRKAQEPRGTPRRARWPGERARRRPSLCGSFHAGIVGESGLAKAAFLEGKIAAEESNGKRWQMFIEAMGSFGLLWRCDAIYERCPIAAA